MNEIIKLIAITETTDEYGRQSIVESVRQIFAEVRSITQSEFYQAAATGLKPEYKFVIADYLDYQGEQFVEYNSVRYSVKRTYRTGYALEITAYGLDT